VSKPRSRVVIAALTLASVIIGVAGAHAGSLPLQWDAPTTNADGTPLSDLASYRIYLGTTTPTCPSASFHTITAPAATPSVGEIVASRIVGLVAGTTYVARVTAVDVVGNESGCSGSASGAAVAELSVAPGAATSFGSTTVGATVDRTFTVQNTSSASLSGSVSIGAPYTVTSGASFTLAPGATRTVTVQFAPTAPGSFAGNVNFTAGGDVVSRSVNGSAAALAVTVNVTKAGTGAGTVTSAPAGIACGADCSETVPPGTSLRLTATPDTGSVFSGWTGACSGTGACAVTMSAARAVTATFGPASVDRLPQPSPVPIVRELSPSWATAGTTGVTLTVEGRGFVAASVVQWNGAPRATSFIDSRRLRAVITADDLASARMATVSVLTPAPGGGLSQSARFMVTPSFRTPTAPSTGNIVIDNAEPGIQDGSRSYTGTWCRAQTPARFGASSLLACGTGIDTYRWTPQIPASGTYEVYVWVAGSRELSRSAPFVVAHAGGTTVRTLDQQNGLGRWVLHGRYAFQAGTEGYVEARSNPAQIEAGRAGADAVRFVRRR
jgi:hypothetical protein